MPLFKEEVSVHSALPPHALLDRIRGLAAGRLPMRPDTRWRSPVRWALREQPRGIRLMPLVPPYYREQGVSFTGAIAAEGSGSGVTGRIQPHGLTVGIAVVLVVVSGVMSIASVVQEYLRHTPSKALPVALFCIGFGVVTLAMVRWTVRFGGAPIRQLLATAACDDSHAIETATVGPADPVVSKTGARSNARVVLRAGAAIDGLIALLLITTSFVSSRVGRPVSLLIAAILASGAGVLWVMADRLQRGANQRSFREDGL